MNTTARKRLSDRIFLEINRAGTSATQGVLNPETTHRAILYAIDLYTKELLEECAVEIEKQNEGKPVGKYEEGFDYGMKVAASLVRAKKGV